MKLKIKEIKKDGKYLKVYIKRPLFKDLNDVYEYLYTMFDDDDCFLGMKLDSSCKYIEAKFILRNKEDIEPYKLDYENAKKTILEKYDYAILVKNSETKLINAGREEQKVKSIYFEHEPRCVPRLNIEK